MSCLKCKSFVMWTWHTIYCINTMIYLHVHCLVACDTCGGGGGGGAVANPGIIAEKRGARQGFYNPPRNTLDQI